MTRILAAEDALNIIPKIPVGEWADTVFDWLVDKLEPFWNFLTMLFDQASGRLVDLLQLPPTLALIAILTVIAFLARGWKVAVFTLLGFALVKAVGMWEPAMATLGLILISAAIAVIFSIPVGILAAQSNTVSSMIRPILDFMQTLHPFVYLPIVVALFGVGAEPGIAATIVFAAPPAVRLTELGIRQVDTEMVEAGEAFGAAPRQILGRIQLPLALSSIMAGVNQVIMLSLSMVVLAALVGAPGLGQEITAAVSNLNIPQGVNAGISLVIIAIFLDRVSGAVGLRSGKGVKAVV